MAKSKKPAAKGGTAAPTDKAGAPKPETAEATSKATDTAATKAETPKASSASSAAKPASRKTPASRSRSKTAAAKAQADVKVTIPENTDTADVEPVKESPPDTKPAPATPAASVEDSYPDIPPRQEEQGSIFWPLVFGGVVAGGLGFLAAEMDFFGNRAAVAEMNTALSGQDARIETLENAEAPAPAEVDLSVVDDVRAEVEQLASQLAAIDERLTVVEKQPIAEGVSDAAVAAYERELSALQSSVEEQRAEIENLLENAMSVEDATAQAALAARQQALLTQISSAINGGQPFAGPLAELAETGVQDIPAALGDVAEGGVATLNSLQTSFPDHARSALAAARAEGTDAGESGVGGFLRRQLGARSVTPREGADPDAVLSRAEAAVRDGRLSDALAEVDSLPEPAQAALQDWRNDANARDAAEAAALALSQSLTAK